MMREEEEGRRKIRSKKKGEEDRRWKKKKTLWEKRFINKIENSFTYIIKKAVATVPPVNTFYEKDKLWLGSGHWAYYQDILHGNGKTL